MNFQKEDLMNGVIPEWMNSDIRSGMIDLFIGKQLGYGASRVVYNCMMNPKYVVKVEYQHDASYNVLEYAIWDHHQEYKPISEWLAPCLMLSHNGRVLIQEKIEIFTSIEDKRLPKKIPSFFTDCKASNWGINKKGKAVCCDYSLVLMMSSNPMKMRNPDWTL